MADNFKLPGSSYEELTKIIKAYASGKEGQPQTLDAIAQSTGMDRTVVSRKREAIFITWDRLNRKNDIRLLLKMMQGNSCQ